MFDLKAIRDNPEDFNKNWARRGLSKQTGALLQLDENRRIEQTAIQNALAKRNELSKEIGKIKSQGGDASALMQEVAKLKDKIAEHEVEEQELAKRLLEQLSSLPNQLQADVPDGPDENHNVEVRRVGTPKRANDVADHVLIGEKLGMMNFDLAAKLSGSRFVVMHTGLARLERALGQFMIDVHTSEHGYREVSAPLLVRDQAMFGTAQLPKFVDDQFRTTNGFWLIPTAEVSLTNMAADMILDAEQLPVRLTALSPCFRSEAGAAGKDTRGIIRQHQFYKVEMVSITTPDQSSAEHERMVGCAENILKKLDLPFRTMMLCAGDTGFSASKTYDIEVWLPAQNKYREISSCSNCLDFQARRMKARCRIKGEKETMHVHTLNGSGVAVGRALVAVLENYYDPADGGIFVPDVLKSYIGGLEKIHPLDQSAEFLRHG